MALAMHPEVVRQAHREIDSVIGEERLPRPEDCVRLPYVQAIVKEATRWHTVGPLCEFGAIFPVFDDIEYSSPSR